jgi:hypothetical protein
MKSPLPEGEEERATSTVEHRRHTYAGEDTGGGKTASALTSTLAFPRQGGGHIMGAIDDGQQLT